MELERSGNAKLFSGVGTVVDVRFSTSHKKLGGYEENKFTLPRSLENRL